MYFLPPDVDPQLSGMRMFSPAEVARPAPQSRPATYIVPTQQFVYYTHTTLFTFWKKAAHIYSKKLQWITNQQHKTLKRYLVQSAQWRHYYVFRRRKFLQKSTFSIVNRNRRQWTVEHLHATAYHREARAKRSHASIVLLSGPKMGFSLRRGDTLPVPNFTIIGAKMWEHIPKTVKISNFEHEFVPQGSLVCTIFTKFSAFVRVSR